MLNPSAAGDLHPDHSHFFDLISCQNCTELFRIVLFIELWAADQCNVITDKFLVEISVGEGGTIGGNQQICIVKIGGVDRYEFDLYRPLGELTGGWRRFGRRGRSVSCQDSGL